MKVKGILLLALVVVPSIIANAQTGPPPPAPVVEKEVEAISDKMRSIQMERFKREAQKKGPDTDAISRENRFKETKKRFEDIQKLQQSIIRTYTTGREINFEKIGRLASEMSDDAIWLDRNLFGAEESDGEAGKGSRGASHGDVKELIIRLDEAIGKFVGSKFFRSSTVVDRDLYLEAQTRLRSVMLLSGRLAAAAFAGR